MAGITENKPRGFLRWVLRAPIWLYYAGLGWILGQRFLLLCYMGRKSGLRRETVIEVVDHDKESDTYYVASAWGTKAGWFQSIRVRPEVEIPVGRRSSKVHAQVLDLKDAADQLFTYAKKHPIAFHEISTLLTGKSLRGTAEECSQLAQSVPTIAFRPRNA